jgi:hypothetical protein
MERRLLLDRGGYTDGHRQSLWWDAQCATATGGRGAAVLSWEAGAECCCCAECGPRWARSTVTGARAATSGREDVEDELLLEDCVTRRVGSG